MKESRRANLLLACAVLIVLGTMAVYWLLLSSWFHDKSAAAFDASKKPAVETARDLDAARSAFQQNILDPRAALLLSEALMKAGRDVDSFYVAEWARGFYPEEDFQSAHDIVVLGKSIPPEKGSAAKDDPDNPALLAELAQNTTNQTDAISIWARLAASAPRSYEGKQALEALGLRAAKSEDGEGGENAQLARETLEEILKARPEEPGPFIALAMALWGRGDSAPARALVAQTMAKAKVNPGAYAVDGALALSDGAADMAIKRFTEAWDRNPDDLLSAGKLAQLLFKQGSDGEAALPFYIALYRQNPDYMEGPQSAEMIIRGILDARRKQLLSHVGVDGLGRYLGSDDASLRAEACARAAQFKDPRWVNTIAALLGDDAEIVRHNADYALYQIAKQSPQSVRARRDEWLAADNPFIRVRALNLFADLYPDETLPLALKALADPNAGARYLVKTLIIDRYYSDVPDAVKAAREIHR